MKRKYYITYGFEKIKIDYTYGCGVIVKQRDIPCFNDFEFNKKREFTNLKEANSAFSACVKQCKHILLNSYEFCEVWLNVLEYNESEDDWEYLDPIKIYTFYKIGDHVKKLI